MRISSSLTNRIFLACTLLATFSLGFAFYFVNARATAEVEAELRRDLSEASTLVDQRRATITDTFTTMARLIADLPKLKAAVETADPPTVQPLADEYREQLDADVLVLTTPKGAVLASAGADAGALAVAGGDAESLDEVSTFLPHTRGLLQVVSVPILIAGEPTDVLGRLTVGFFLDDRRASQIKAVTGSEIAFAAEGHVLSASLPQESRAALSPLLGSVGMASVTLQDGEYLMVARPMVEGGTAATPADAAPITLILRSRTDRLRFLNTLRAGLAGVLIVTLLLATILSYGVARTMTRPLATVTDAMRDVAATGDLTRKVPVRSRVWDDEDARLLGSAFNTLTESIARFQREAAQRERLSSLGRMSTVIAHEIRNPLMIIRTSLAALKRPRVSAAQVREAAADIDEETQRLNRIVTEVLDFAKPIRFDFAEANLNDVCRSSTAAACAGGSEGEVQLALDPTLPAIVTDAERLRTALVNILTNARQAVQACVQAGTPRADGSVGVLGEPGVVVRTEQRPGRVTISITDQGVGMAPEDVAHMFDPYYTTRRAGTGLGLPIAKNIIEGLGGVITVASRQHKGTEICIELPTTMGRTS